MNLHQLQPTVKNRAKTRVGRGIAAGQGKTAGRGTKGQKSRSGYNIPRKFEGGQSPLYLRLPKVRGFTKARGHNPDQETIIIDRALLNKYFKDGEVVSPATLLEKGLIKSVTGPIKILGKTEITVKVTFENVTQSNSKA